MSAVPLYNGLKTTPAYHLRYSWTCWPSADRFIELPAPQILDALKPKWMEDELNQLEYNWSAKKIQLTFSATPRVSPAFVAQRAKGRLQHALREAGCPQRFSRKVSVRTVGNNTTEAVIAYIERQVGNERFADPVFSSMLDEFTFVNSTVDLAAPTESSHGRYWYNLHLVLVTASRGGCAHLDRLRTTFDGVSRIADVKGYRVGAQSVMPDHLHVALRGHYQQSPHEIALSFQNNLSYLMGQERWWQENYYVGTFSEYDMWAIRNRRLVEANCST